ncbi:SulP family inorganic anion transporter [Maribacter hydrothermalis]|uniref:Sodium-independent anion transporter n=1 Tax=Maribacter hydrothermalis TaxID=1836467 RepID=A0A1B7ZCB7_9FLAO|nr:solute carrier family 26 protein [Maribacter hydrothermalis]APQ18009.1 sodium-independent anion transporter [Maribacter hydrothermalis]OBR40550.1 sodium-independent anion transporter [Maribacter hydrothermalis]
MKNIFPFLEWVSTYKKAYFIKDLLAGLTVGIVLVPQGMAYAMIAGLPPVHGLYAALFPVLTYAFLGTSRKIAVGPVAMDSLLIAVGLGTLTITGIENYIKMVMVLALMVGVIQLLLGILRMGFLVNFLSKPVISGFTSAAAIIIVLSQLKHILGISVSNSNKIYQTIRYVFYELGNVNWFDFGLGILGIVLLVGIKKWNKNIPGILIIVVLGILAVYFFKMESYGVKLVGSVPSGLPSLVMPTVDFEDVRQLWPIALALALVGYLEAISIGKAIEDKTGEDTIKANQELIALGSSNIVGSLFQGFPVTASFSRSAISYDAGTKTNLSAMFSVVLVVLTLLFLTPVFQYLPNAILASIIMVSVVKLIDVQYFKILWNNRKDEFFILLITFFITLFVGITEGILIGVLCSLLLMVYRTSKPHFVEIGNIGDSDYYKNVIRFADEVIVRNDLLIVRFDSQLYFGNSAYFKKQLLKHIRAKGPQLKGIILNAEAINYIDATAADMLSKLIHDIRERGLQFYIAGAIGPTRDIIFNTGIIEELQREFLFVKTKEAVDFFDNPNEVSLLAAKVAYENSITARQKLKLN